MYYVYRGSFCLGSCRFFSQVPHLISQVQERESGMYTSSQYLYSVKIFSNSDAMAILPNPRNNTSMRDVTDIFIRKEEVPAYYLGATVSNQSLRTANLDVFILRRNHARILEGDDLSFLEEDESAMCQLVRAGTAITYRLNNLDNFRMIESGVTARNGYIIENPSLLNTGLVLEHLDESIEHLVDDESAEEPAEELAVRDWEW